MVPTLFSSILCVLKSRLNFHSSSLFIVLIYSIDLPGFDHPSGSESHGVPGGGPKWGRLGSRAAGWWNSFRSPPPAEQLKHFLHGKLSIDIDKHN